MSGLATLRQGVSTTATIAASGTKTNAIEAKASVSFGVVIPSGFTGTTVTFEVSADNTTYQALNNTSGAVSMTVAAAKSYTLPADLTPWPWFKIVSGSTESSARSLVIVRKR